MKLNKTIELITAFLLFSGLLLGCTTMSENPTQSMLSESDPSMITDMPDEIIDAQTNRHLIAEYTLEFDAANESANESVTVHPSRSADAHYEIFTSVPMEIQLKSYDTYTSVWTVDVTLSNTFPISGFDPRLIFYTDNSGYRLMNPDDWTAQWDIAGGMVINPFIAYASDDPLRKFQAMTEYTDTAQVYLPVMTPVSLALDISYPSNCEEPYRIRTSQQGQMYDLTGPQATLFAIVDDHQDDVTSVSLYCPVITGETLSSFTQTAPGEWKIELNNKNAAGSGNYYGVILAQSGAGTLYDIATFTVLHSAYNATFDFVNTWGAISDEACESIATDDYRNMYAGGNFRGEVDFGDGNPITTGDSYYACLVKYNPDGSFGWVRAWGDDDLFNDSCVKSVAVLNNSLYATGYFCGTVDFGDGPVTSNDWDIFLCKFSTDGDLIWVKTFGGNGSEAAYSLTTDGIDNIYFSGAFMSPTDFGGGIIEPEMVDGFICNYKSSGAFADVYTCGGTLLNSIYDVHVYGNKVFSCGTHSDDTDFGNGTPVNVNGDNDIFYLILNNDLSFNTVKTWGGSSTESATSLTLDSSGNAYIGGYFKGTVNFGTGGIASHGDEDCFLVKYDSSNTLKWVKTWGGVDFDIVRSVTTSANGFIYIAGDFEKTVDFGDGFQETTVGPRSGFLCKLTPANKVVGIGVIGGGEDSGFASIYSVDASNSGDLCLGGYHRYGVDFGDGNTIWAYGDAFALRWLETD